MLLPDDFTRLMRSHLGSDLAETLFRGLDQPPTTAVRLNPAKAAHLTLNPASVGDPVPWCPGAYYLDGHRAFTFDPLFHAGAYYVQDASSMYLAHLLASYLPSPCSSPSSPPTSYLLPPTSSPSSSPTSYLLPPTSSPLPPLLALDLCAAPGGKSTLLASHLPEGSLLVSNEPMRKRAQVLAENMQKWCSPVTAGARRSSSANVVVTQNFPDEFARFSDTFDFILTDVPCSGEGMFRKDPVALSEWSLDNVRQCAQRQRDILRAILPTLKPGGLLVYSTCTFNRHEDEDQVRWLMADYGLQLLEERHFLPGRDRGEGLYFAALRRPGLLQPSDLSRPPRFLKGLTSLASVGLESVADDAPRFELTYDQAIAYLRREALHVAAPRGPLVVTYRSLPLGPAKSVGSRLNNLYPSEWRIRTTYSPSLPLPQLFL